MVCSSMVSVVRERARIDFLDSVGSDDPELGHETSLAPPVQRLAIAPSAFDELADLPRVFAPSVVYATRQGLRVDTERLNGGNCGLNVVGSEAAGKNRWASRHLHDLSAQRP